MNDELTQDVGPALAYYRERNGDYMAADLSARCPSGDYDCRAAALAGVASSVCTTGASAEYLRQCRKVRRERVPLAWLRHIDG